MPIADVIDSAIEAPVVTSFTNIGYAVRSRLDEWRPLGDYDVSGRTMLVTGATSGLGLALAKILGRCGAHVIVVGRSPEKTARVVAEELSPVGSFASVLADMGELDQVRTACDEVLATHSELDVVVHNAGALTAEHETNSAGHEQTVASQVYGPFLMTSLLLPALEQGIAGRVLTMTSGGMYTQGLTVRNLEMSERDYKGAEQYARAKRAQVTLTEMWAERHATPDVRFHSAHPGWADTPGVAASLPTFRKIVGPFLRSPEEGADTMAWLAMDDTEPLATNGKLWLDRRVRNIHKVGRTRDTDTPERRNRLWDHVAAAAGLSTPPDS